MTNDWTGELFKLLEVTQLKGLGRRFSQIYADNNFKSAFMPDTAGQALSVYLRPKFLINGNCVSSNFIRNKPKAGNKPLISRITPIFVIFIREISVIRG
jgi:hypothetical protein